MSQTPIHYSRFYLTVWNAAVAAGLGCLLALGAPWSARELCTAATDGVRSEGCSSSRGPERPGPTVVAPPPQSKSFSTAPRVSAAANTFCCLAPCREQTHMNNQKTNPSGAATSSVAALQAAPAPTVSASLPTTADPVLHDDKPVTNMMGFWFKHAYVALNNFVNKSLSNFAYNIAIGCGHGCLWCFVPETSTIKQGEGLAAYGVKDPDAQWGEYALLRTWDEKKFLSSVCAAENIPDAELKRDGNRAIIFCSTTDGWQVIRHPDPVEQKKLNEHRRFIVRRALELIRDYSSLNVRVLTRSPLAREDFDLFKTFGPRLTFGMSLPTLNNNLAKIYEPKAPAPSQRLATLRAAKTAGLHVFVAIAPTYPECDEADLRATLTAVAELDPITVFMEPINVRAENLARMKSHAAEIGATINTSVFETEETWQDYALNALHTVERLAGEVGLADVLHLWPDAALGSKDVLKRVADPVAHQGWLNRWWSRVSEWPTS